MRTRYWVCLALAALCLTGCSGFWKAPSNGGGGGGNGGGGTTLSSGNIYVINAATNEAALMMFSKTLANEVVGDGIRVNTINPGLVLTPDWVKTAKQIAGEDGYKAHLQSVADEAGGMKRFATPEELANFFVFLASDRASYSTGSTYFVDGGWLRTV